MKGKNPGIITLVFVLLVTSSTFFVGCSSKPDAEQLRQLSSLKEESSALQREAASKEQAKATLEREIAEKNAKLKKCNDDQQIVKQRLAK
jgi:septal ring factor EnvC (AmiA/AmiB activator)